MTIRSIFTWQDPDSTFDLNERFNYLVAKGLLWGGAVGTSASLTVPVNPLIAVNHDGMTVISTAVENVTVVAGQTNVVVLYAKYNALGVPAVPVETITVFDWATYNTHPDKAWMNILAVITLAPAAVTVTAADIDYTTRDEVDVVGRSAFRGITTFALLPTPASATNRVGDFYWTSDHQVFYFWNGTTWEALNTGSYNAETTVMNDQLERSQRDRLVEGSGVLAGTRPGGGDYSSYREVDPIETPFVANSMDVDSFSAVINGHYMETHAQTIGFPLAADRYDLVFLEVWREDIVTPENQQYDRNPDGTLKYTIQQVDDQEEAVAWVKGMAGNNYDFNIIGSYNHGFRVLKYRLAIASGVPQLALTNPNDATVVALATNVDGVAFNAPPAGSDDRAWIANSVVTPVDGYSWAIPIFVVRRLAAENPGIGEGIKVFRSGIRHVFPVYPICDISNAARGTLETLQEQFPVEPSVSTKGTWDEPSGFLTGIDFPIGAGVGANTIQFYDDRAKIRIKGFEDWFALSSTDVDLGAAPLAGWERVLVFLKMNITLYDNDPSVVTNYMLSPQHRPYVPSFIGSNFRSQGWKKGYVSYELVVENLGATNVLDEHDAMAAAAPSPVSANPWVRGDVTAPAANRYDDGGIWSRTLLELEDDRCHPFAAEWAIPICLAHRRNQAAYNFQSNPNGTGSSRPDSRTAFATVHPDDLVDLRHQVGLDSNTYKEVIEENIDALMKGQLRTRLANKFLGAGGSGAVAGSRILQADIIGVAPGAFELTAPDGMRRIWSDAREFHIVAVTIDMSAAGPVVGDLYEWQHLSPTEAELKIKSPPGSSIVRHMPAQMYIDGNTLVNPNFQDFYGPPCWTTRIERNAGGQPPNPAHSKFIDSSKVTQDIPYNYYGPGSGIPATMLPAPTNVTAEPFYVTSTDSLGRAIQMTGFVDISGAAATGTAVLSWWVHFDRTYTNTDNYDDNFGLAEIPDVVHRVTKDPLGASSQINVGVLAATVKKSFVGAATVSFTAANVQGVAGLPGNYTILGFDYENVVFSPNAAISTAEITDVQDQLDLNMTAPFTGDAEVTIFFETDVVNEWVEIGRGGKSVQAIMSWHQQIINFGGVPVGTDYSFNMGSSIWYPPQIDGRLCGLFPQFWTRTSTVPGTPWVLKQAPYWPLGGAGVGTPYSNLVDFNDQSLDQYTYVLVAKHEPLPTGAANHLLIEYTYTPYQGQSSEGGETPVVGTVLPKLKNLLHGRIEENSDFYATQSGPASYFSGVFTWTGLPVNNQLPHERMYGLPNIVGLERFTEYNRTAVVKETKSAGTLGLNHVMFGEVTFNAASVLRLPYPTHYNLMDSLYHRGVADFDLDPVRAGASSGTLSYAPGYSHRPYDNRYYNLRYDHFLNSLSPLSLRGKPREAACNLTVTPDKYNSVNSDGTVEFNTSNWRVLNPNGLDLVAGIDPGVNNILKRTVSQAYIDFPFGYTFIFAKPVGLQMYSPLATNFLATFGPPYDPADFLIRTDSLTVYPGQSFIPGFVAGTNKVAHFVTCPGEIDYYYKNILGINQVTPVIWLWSVPTAPADNFVYDTTALMDTDYGSADTELIDTRLQNRFVDTVKVPISSQSSQVDTNRSHAEPHMTPATGQMTFRGFNIGYPPGWSAGDIATLEGMILGAQDLKGAGRGLFLGDTVANSRFAMPVLVPGSGTDLTTVLMATYQTIDIDSQPPPKIPTIPGEPLFEEGNRIWTQYDHGGPIAYVFMGMFVNPVSDEFKNRLVLQISGGPTGKTSYPSSNAGNPSPTYYYSSESVEATALDAFWPRGRPLLSPNKKH